LSFMSSARISSSVGSPACFQAPITSMTVSTPNFASIMKKEQSLLKEGGQAIIFSILGL